jgi:hypothetical protein
MLSAKDLALVNALAAKMSPALVEQLKTSPALPKELWRAVNEATYGPRGKEEPRLAGWPTRGRHKSLQTE